MPHLSSCYFCGASLDEPLDDYRIAPADPGEGDDATTVTLCSPCHSKLERLLELVVEAAGAPTPDAPGAGRAEAGESVAAADEPGGEVADDGQLIDVDSDLAEMGDPESPEPESGGGADTSPGVAEAGEDEEGGDPSEGGPPGASDPAEAGDPTDSAGAAEPDEDATAEGVDPSGTETDAADSHQPDADDGDTSAATAQGDGDETDAERPDAGAAARTTVSALEYNKVMRLLQNREFPVDRAEIQAVAANAYGLADHECAEVIDLAIDRGLIAERDGELVRPE